METKREKIILSILIGIVLMLWSIQQYLANQLYYETPEYVKNQEMSNKYEQSNNELRLNVLTLTSFTWITQQAQKQGYVPATFIYLNVCGGCASKSP